MKRCAVLVVCEGKSECKFVRTCLAAPLIQHEVLMNNNIVDAKGVTKIAAQIRRNTRKFFTHVFVFLDEDKYTTAEQTRIEEAFPPNAECHIIEQAPENIEGFILKVIGIPKANLTSSKVIKKSFKDEFAPGSPKAEVKAHEVSLGCLQRDPATSNLKSASCMTPWFNLVEAVTS